MAIVTYQKNSGAKVSKNFRVSEFSCHGNGCCINVKIDDELVEYLQKIRDHFGKEVVITSGYRCPVHNKNVGGTTSSYHMNGMAADISVSGIKPAEVAKYAETIGVMGIGLYETSSDGYFVHIDTRSKKSFWYGQRQAYRSTFGGSGYSKEQFIKDVQKSLGATVDGIAGPNTLNKTITISSKTNSKHTVVKCLQKRLHALGYSEIGTADGIAGAKFTSAVAHFQQDNGCTVDGIMTAKNKTWKKILGME